jgi:hypothetical protein
MVRARLPSPGGRADEEALAGARLAPEPELLSIRDATASREALERAGEDIWRAALDYLYGHALERAMGTPSTTTRSEPSSSAPPAVPRRPARTGDADGGARRVRPRVAPHTVSA